jgi:hypothetical protein
VRIDQVGRTAASALLLDESGEVLAAPVRVLDTRANGRRRRSPASSADLRGTADQPERRGRRRRAPVEGEDAEARREAGLGEPPTGIDAQPEEESAVGALAANATGTDDAGEDDLQSKPRRRGRRGGRRRSAAKAKATPE